MTIDRHQIGKFTASVTREGRWFVVQCMEVDVVSQGRSERSALANLAEALELYFEPPVDFAQFSASKRR